jgi:general secretion pathway protein D
VGQAGGGARGVTLPGGTQAAVPGQPGPQGPPPIFKQEVRIVADEVTNSLIVLATRRDFDLILDVLRRIDVVPRQVVLEVTIAEIGLTKDMEFGVAWALAEGKLSDTVAENNAASNIFGTAPRGLPVGGFSSGVPRVPSFGAFAVISDNEHFTLFINAVAQKTNVKMLSAPHIIAADNREAHILIGESIPILTSTASNILQAGNTATVNSVQYRDTGKILTVLPQVNSKGLVNLQIRQEVSDVGAPSFGNTGSPSFNTREAETTVVVQDGHSVIIGGIIDDAITHSRRGVPYMMDIPIVGRAFRVETDSVQRNELIVLITPYVIRSVREADDVTGDLADRVEGLNRLRALMKPERRRRVGDVPPPIEEPAGPRPERREGAVQDVNPGRAR